MPWQRHRNWKGRLQRNTLIKCFVLNVPNKGTRWVWGRSSLLWWGEWGLIGMGPYRWLDKRHNDVSGEVIAEATTRETEVVQTHLTNIPCPTRNGTLFFSLVSCMKYQGLAFHIHFSGHSVPVFISFFFFRGFQLFKDASNKDSIIIYQPLRQRRGWKLSAH